MKHEVREGLGKYKIIVITGRYLAQLMHAVWDTHCPLSEYPDLSPGSISTAVLFMWTLGASSNGSGGWVSAIRVGHLDCVPGSQLQPVLASTALGMRGVNW